MLAALAGMPDPAGASFADRLERNLTERFTNRHAVAVSSGTTALHAALSAVGVGPGDEVLVPALTVVMTAAPLAQLGATAVFVDSAPDTLDLDYDDAAAKVAARTKAIVPVHLWGRMGDPVGLRSFAAEHGLPFLTIADLIKVRDAERAEVRRVATAALPTVFGDFQAAAYRTCDGAEHLAIVLGDVAAQGVSEDGVLVRVHSECLTGDIIGSLRCDCGAQLEHALAAISREGCGAVIYLRGHEGRGIGLANKITAYSLQEDGLDTVDANVVQGLPVDARDYGHAAGILADLGVHNVRLISNNPAKSVALREHGLSVVEQVTVPYAENPHNVRYLRAKENRMGHQKLDTVAM